MADARRQTTSIRTDAPSNPGAAVRDHATDPPDAALGAHRPPAVTGTADHVQGTHLLHDVLVLLSAGLVVMAVLLFWLGLAALLLL